LKPSSSKLNDGVSDVIARRRFLARLGFAEAEVDALLALKHAWVWACSSDELEAQLQAWTSVPLPPGVDATALARRHPTAVFKAGRSPRVVQGRAATLAFLASEVGTRKFTGVLASTNGLLMYSPEALSARLEALVDVASAVGVPEASARRNVARQPQLLGTSLRCRLVPSLAYLITLGCPLQDLNGHLESLALALEKPNAQNKLLMMLKYGLRPSDISPVLLKYSLKRLGPRRALLKELRLPHTVASLKKWASITDQAFARSVLAPHGMREDLFPAFIREYAELLPAMLEEAWADEGLRACLPPFPTPDEAQDILEAHRAKTQASARDPGRASVGSTLSDRA